MPTAPSLFAASPRRGPLRRLLDLFSSVRLGIALMAVLFVYATIGSAGIIYPAIGPGRWNLFDPSVWRHEMPRQWPAFELTEFEWFHTPFFNALIALICANIIITTIRRIRLNALTIGVWMIHTGIIILCAGSVVYFSTKFEGDTPVIRREVVLSIPGAPPATLPALPGAATTVRTPEGDYFFAVSEIDPSWELRSGADEGKRAYSVMIDVRTPTARFVRQLLDGYPEYTEDVLPGRGRVKRLPEFGGRALVDETLSLSLAPTEQAYFWLKDSAALCARFAGESEWSQRPIGGLPRYNDYVSSVSQDLWPVRSERGDPPLKPRLLDIRVPPSREAGEADDPLAGVEARITGHLRYAVMRRDFVPGRGPLNPVIELTLATPDGSEFTETLAAFDEARRSAYEGKLTFDWVDKPAELESYMDAGLRELVLRVPEAGLEEMVRFRLEDIASRDRPMIPLGETGWQYRIRDAKDRLPLMTGRSVTLLLVDLVNPEGRRMTRWVFEDPSRNRDNPESTDPADPHAPLPPDPRLETLYRPGKMLATISVVGVAGDDAIHVFSDDGRGGRTRAALRIGETATVIHGITIRPRRLITHAAEEERPMIVPPRQRDRDADAMRFYTLVRVELSLPAGSGSSGGWSESRWVPFHRYSFDDPIDPLSMLSRFEPARFDLPDGRRVEVIVSRERRRLPHPVVLDDFILTAHVGGFTGRTSSIRDWTSMIRVKEGGSWSGPIRVSTNNPGEHRGVWFFQSFWDPPRQARFPGDASSAGLNFTGLGVGNRRGVYVQLFGSCLAVAGMIYAFYVKPIIRRRRQAAALAGLGEACPPTVDVLAETPVLTGDSAGREQGSRA